MYGSAMARIVRFPLPSSDAVILQLLAFPQPPPPTARPHNVGSVGVPAGPWNSSCQTSVHVDDAASPVQVDDAASAAPGPGVSWRPTKKVTSYATCKSAPTTTAPHIGRREKSLEFQVDCTPDHFSRARRSNTVSRRRALQRPRTRRDCAEATETSVRRAISARS